MSCDSIRIQPKQQEFKSLLISAATIPAITIFSLTSSNGRHYLQLLRCSHLLPSTLSPLLLQRHHLKVRTNHNSTHNHSARINSVLNAKSEHTTIQWNTTMKSRIDAGSFITAISIFNAMRVADCRPDCYTFPLIIRAISSVPDQFDLGEAVHGLGIKSGFRNNIYFCNTMIELYVRYDRVDRAAHVFDETPERDAVSWTSLISGSVKVGDLYESFRLFYEMQLDGSKPTYVTVAVILRACNLERDLVGGRKLHSFAIKSGFADHELVQNSILMFYSKVSSCDEMEKFFVGLERKSVVSWNIIMSAYYNFGDIPKIVDCLTRMKDEASPNSETLTLVISAYRKIHDLLEGQKLHSFAVKSGQLDEILVSSFIAFYAECGELALAVRLFEEVKEDNRVAWSAMMSGFIQNGEYGMSIDMLQKLPLNRFDLCIDILRGLILSYSNLGSLRLGKTVHGCWIRNKKYADLYDESSKMETSILNMYVNCGSISLAKNCFDLILVKDVVAWSSMIEGFAVHGLGLEALWLFIKMQEQGIKPNNITFLSLLNACSHSGLVAEACEVFNCMTTRYKIEPELNHYTCMVDLLGRSGKLYEALEIIDNMIISPDARIWGSLLASSRMHCDGKLGTYAAQKLFKLEPQNVGYHILLSNIHASDDNWNVAEELRNTMNEKAKKNPGWSCIEVNDVLHMFVAGDRTHPQIEKIKRMLGCFGWQMQEIS